MSDYNEKYSVKLKYIQETHDLEIINIPDDYDKRVVDTSEIGRAGLLLIGFHDCFDKERMQVMGRTEFEYFKTLTEKELVDCLYSFFALLPNSIVVSRNIDIPEIFILAAKKNEIPVLRSEQTTSELISALMNTLNVELAPRITRHGVLVEVYGEGILLMGDSGVGKSETAVELVKRGHRLIADDAVEIRRVSARTLVGTSPENIRHYMELRGIGIINVRQIFGIGAVKITQQIDIVINLENWDKHKEYDRMGLKNETTEILGNLVSQMTIPVKPGRNLAMIIEVAAMNHRQKLMGYNSAQDLLTSLGMMDEEEIAESAEDDPTLNKYEGW